MSVREDPIEVRWTSGLFVVVDPTLAEKWASPLFEKAFDPSQPRDAKGRWTDTGASASPAEIEATIQRMKVLEKETNFQSQGRDAIMYLGYRGVNDQEAHDMFKSMSQASDEQSALRAFESKGKWDTGWAFAHDEWEAAERLGANGERHKLGKIDLQEAIAAEGGYRFRDPRVPLTDTELAAFASRQSFMQEAARRRFGDTVEVYRGIAGRQGGKLGRPGEQVDLQVYSLSSWSTNLGTALNFAKGSRGRVLKARVPVDKVWSVREVGIRPVIRFSDDAGEVVLINTEKTIRAEVVR